MLICLLLILVVVFVLVCRQLAYEKKVNMLLNDMYDEIAGAVAETFEDYYSDLEKEINELKRSKEDDGK